jgi:hypothetical protein
MNFRAAVLITGKMPGEHPGFAKASNGQEVVEVSTTKF